MKITREELVRLIAEEVMRLQTEQNHDAPKANSSPIPVRTDERSDRAVRATQEPKQIRKPDKSVDVKGEALEILKSSTAARIGIGRSGPRLTTDEMLKFRADHAAARDSVQRNVDPDFIRRMGFLVVNTLCRDKNEYLTRPDLGRKLSDEAKEQIKAHCAMSPQVQIVAAGGLSSVAIQANLETILPVLTDGLAAKGIRMGTPFYVENARVGVEDEIAVLLDAEVVCILIGERPGLMTAESMSAYIVYRGYPGMPESGRTVVSNIHKGGTAAAEAGAYITDIIGEILKAKVSGVELKR